MSDAGLEVVRAADLLAQPPEQHWLIRPLWARSAVGVIGGAPKSAKTWLGLEMAISVASRTPCLGRFSAEVQGPALIYLAEDALAQVRQRIDAICRFRGLSIGELDVHVITAATLRLDLAQDQQKLHAAIATLGPRLLLLDPLVRMHRLDENSASEISGLLSFLRELQRRHDLAVILVHHASKKRRAQPGQSLRGSSDLHAFGDSNAYLVRNKEQLTLTLEHRSAPAPEPMNVQLICRDDEAISLQVVGSQGSEDCKPSIHEAALQALTNSATPLTRSALRSTLRVNNQRLGDALQELVDRGQIEKTPNGYQLQGTAGPVHKQRKRKSVTPTSCFESSLPLPGAQAVGSLESGETESGAAGKQPDKG